MLFVLGTNDEIVPPHHIYRLHEAATSAPFKKLHQVLGGSHNDTWLKGGKDYIYAIKDFLVKAQEQKPDSNTNQASGRGASKKND
jgi:fermentation-respiration switch protein FrsA (DUF1100 family)